MSMYQRAVPYLTTLSYGTTPFITTFLLIHLSAPALANLGGSALTSQTMLLGREYYQTAVGEPYLVLGPLALHIAASLAKRLAAPRAAAPPPRALRSPLASTGYAAALLLLPHLLTHRVHPADPAPPVAALGPAELDAEFVKLGLAAWPGRAWALYGALVLAVAVHAADGAGLVWGALRGPRGGRRARRARRYGALALAGLVLSGLGALAREPLFLFASTAARIRAAYAKSFIYRI